MQRGGEGVEDARRRGRARGRKGGGRGKGCGMQEQGRSKLSHEQLQDAAFRAWWTVSGTCYLNHGVPRCSCVYEMPRGPLPCRRGCITHEKARREGSREGRRGKGHLEDCLNGF